MDTKDTDQIAPTPKTQDPKTQLVSLKEAADYNMWKEYQSLYGEIKVKKRELKELDARYKKLQTSIVKFKDPMDDTDKEIL